MLDNAGSVAAQGPAVTQEPGDAERGLAIYAERCARCHGPLGAGDGEMAADLPQPPRAFTDPIFRQEAAPARLYDVITNGLVERGMPPFGPASSNPISDADRWHLTAAIYSLATPPETVEQGRVVYEARCQNCHGPEGQGDGPDAAALAQPPPDLTDLVYWRNTSNAEVLQRLTDGRVTGHDFTLGAADAEAVVSYARTFSYAYVDPALAFAPLATATISGQVVNGTTGGVAPAGTNVALRAFDNFSVTLALTTTVEADGRYQFDLADASPQWLYVTAADYGGVNFTSPPGELSRSQSALELPITVFEQATDPAAVTVDQLHFIVDFVGDRLQVSELYVAGNNADTVFVGETGEPADGTFRLALPAGAGNANFQRGLGSFDQFVPAGEVVPMGSNWADRLPVRPGSSTLILLANYNLPYKNGMTISHRVYYQTGGVTLIMPDAGVTVTEGDGWIAEGQQIISGGTVLSYRREGVSAGSSLTLHLEGQPQAVTNPAGGRTLVRNENTELIIGGVALLVVVGAAVFVVRRWQPPEMEAEGEAADPRTLIQAIADLDDAYEAGEIGEKSYTRQRRQLKAELMALWDTKEEV